MVCETGEIVPALEARFIVTKTSLLYAGEHTPLVTFTLYILDSIFDTVGGEVVPMSIKLEGLVKVAYCH